MSQEPFEIDGHLIAPSPSLNPIQNYVLQAQSEVLSRVCVDIGASDGLIFSNSLFLYMNGWTGLSIEADSVAFERMRSFYQQYLAWVRLKLAHVTPGNVCKLLAEANIPSQFGFLSLDIDSFDYDVLEALLKQFRPRVICAEINEKIPPPIRFWVPFREDHVYTGGHFYGMSLSALTDLAHAHDYQLVSLWFNNAFLIAREHNHWPVQSVDEAYTTGFLSCENPAYNLNMTPLQTLSPEAGLEFIRSHFAAYAGRYVLKLEA